MSFRALCHIAAVLFAGLFLVLTLAPGTIWWLFGIDETAAGNFGFRRSAMVFLGLAVIVWGARDAPASALRHTLSLGLAVMMGAMAALGAWELARGFAGPGILMAVSIETVLAVGFARLVLRERAQA